MFKKRILLLLSAGLFSCVKDKPVPIVPAPVSATTHNRVVMTAEGNYGSSNAAVYVWDQQSEQSTGDVYKAANGKACGDVLQSLLHDTKRYFLVINNSGKIIVTDEEFKKTAELTGFSSPRYLVKVSDAKAYLSDLRSDKISILNLKDLSVKGSIACKGWTEQMVVIYNKVFVSNLSSRYLFVINAATDAIIDSIEVGTGAGSLVTDKNDKLWALSRGSTIEKAQLVQIDALTHQILQKVNIEGAPFNLCAASNGEDLYFIQSGIYHYSISSSTLTKLVDEPQANFYGLAIEPVSGDLFAADAMDYTQSSTIRIYSKNGLGKKSLKAGINTSGFYFD